MEIPTQKVCQIYPYVPDINITSKYLQEKANQDILKLLYIAQGRRFKSKGGLEVIEAFGKVRETMNVSLTIISHYDLLTVDEIEKIRDFGIRFIEFNLPFSELEKFYLEHHVLLQPSSDDSFGMTVLEAMKAGMALITSDMYAFKEMVENNKNGFLIEPSYRFFKEDNIPNPAVWNHRQRTLYSGKINNKLIDDIIDRITRLYRNRELLFEFMSCSLEKAALMYSCDSIKNAWNKLFINDFYE